MDKVKVKWIWIDALVINLIDIVIYIYKMKRRKPQVSSKSILIFNRVSNLKILTIRSQTCLKNSQWIISLHCYVFLEIKWKNCNLLLWEIPEKRTRMLPATIIIFKKYRNLRERFCFNRMKSHSFFFLKKNPVCSLNSVRKMTFPFPETIHN